MLCFEVRLAPILFALLAGIPVLAESDPPPVTLVEGQIEDPAATDIQIERFHALRAVSSLIKAFNDHDPAAMASLWTRDVEVSYVAEDGTATVAHRGRESLVGELATYFEEFPDVKSELLGAIGGPNWISARERVTWTADSGTRTQEALAVYQMQEGLVRRVWYYPATP